MLSYKISNHASEQAKQRGIQLEVIQSIVERPEQILQDDNNRKVYQSQVIIDNKLYLVRVFIEMTDPMTVVTVYKTSKIKKYWKDDLS